VLYRQCVCESIMSEMMSHERLDRFRRFYTPCQRPFNRPIQHVWMGFVSTMSVNQSRLGMMPHQPNDISIGSAIFAHHVYHRFCRFCTCRRHSIGLYSMCRWVLYRHRVWNDITRVCRASRSVPQFLHTTCFCIFGSIFPVLKGFTRRRTGNHYHKTSKP